MGRTPCVLSELGSTQQLQTEVFPKTTLVCVCVCVCVCLSVCLSVCLPVVRLLSQEGRVLGGRRGDKGGASVGQRGGAEALRSTAPPWLPVGLGSGQVPGKLGAQDSLRLGPQEVQRPPGRGEIGRAHV